MICLFFLKYNKYNKFYLIFITFKQYYFDNDYDENKEDEISNKVNSESSFQKIIMENLDYDEQELASTDLINKKELGKTTIKISKTLENLSINELSSEESATDSKKNRTDTIKSVRLRADYVEIENEVLQEKLSDKTLQISVNKLILIN